LYDEKEFKLRQERHISPLTGLENFVGWFSTKIPLLTELEFSNVTGKSRLATQRTVADSPRAAVNHLLHEGGKVKSTQSTESTSDSSHSKSIPPARDDSWSRLDAGWPGDCADLHDFA
jgi:hypothetical protein